MSGEGKACGLVTGDSVVSEADVAAVAQRAVALGATRILCEDGPVAEATSGALASWNPDGERPRLEVCVAPRAPWPESADRVHVVPGPMGRYLAKECDLVAVVGRVAPLEALAYARAYGKTVLNASEPP